MRRLFVATAAVVSAGVIGLSPVIAQVSALQRCEEVQRKVTPSLWERLEQAADQTVCRRPWMERQLEFAACAAADLTLRFGSALKTRWNSFFAGAGAEWATLGPRHVGAVAETGTIQGGFKRTFLGVGLPRLSSRVEVRKTDGRAQGNITVCQIARDGNRVLSAQRFTIENGAGSRPPVTTTIANPELSLVAVVVDTPAGVNSLGYSVRVTDVGGNGGPAASGLADIHVHQFADVGFGGRALMGEHHGPKATALAPDQLSSGQQNLVDLAASIVNDPTAPISAPAPGSLSLDANLAMVGSQLLTGQNLSALVSGGNVSSWANRNEDGFFQIGGGGAPSFTTWPHHADRGHQQVHEDWLRAAHDRGLNLMVASLVHSPFLCNAFKIIDPYGNIAGARDRNGQITQWASANWACDTQANIDRQIAAAHALDRAHDWYEIVMSPQHAREVIAEGKLAVVLAIESDGVLNDQFGEGDFEAELHRLRRQGVTSLQLVHERDSRFCGAAPHRDSMEALQYLRYGVQTTGSLLVPGIAALAQGSAFNRDQNGRNRVGLQPDGTRLVDLMVSQGMPIDIAHSSVACRRDIFGRIAAGPGLYGIYDSHTKFERLVNPNLTPNHAARDAGFTPAAHEREEEFLVTEDLMTDYRRHDVLVGLRTAAVDVYSAPLRSDGRPGVANTCPGSARTYAQLVDFATASGLDVAFGSDLNGLIAQTGPRFGPNRCYAANIPGADPGRAAAESTEFPQQVTAAARRTTGAVRATAPVRSPRTVADIDGKNYYRDGLVNIAWLPELYQDLRTLNAPGAEMLANSAESYLQMWGRAWARRSQ